SRQGTQNITYLTDQTVGIPVAHQNIAWCLFQKCTHLRLSAPDRYIQCFGCEDAAGAGLADAQIVGEHYLIIVNILRLRTTQLDRQQGDEPPVQPAVESIPDILLLYIRSR